MAEKEKIITFILKKLKDRDNVDEFFEDIQGNTALFLTYLSSIEQLKLKIMEKLLENGADPNIKDDYNVTIFSKIIQESKKEDIPILKLLAKYGADLDEGNPLRYACHFKKPKEIVEFIIHNKRKTYINAVTFQSVLKYDENIAEYLLKNKMVDLTNKEYEFSWYDVVHEESKIKLLFSYGARFTGTENYSFIKMIIDENLSYLEEFIQTGADLTKPELSMKNKTPLEYAFRVKNEEAFGLLLPLYSKTNLILIYQKTKTDMSSKKSKALNALLEQQILSKNNNNQTVFHKPKL